MKPAPPVTRTSNGSPKAPLEKTSAFGRRRHLTQKTRRVARQRPARAIVTETSEISLPGDRIDTLWLLPRVAIDSAALKPTAEACAWILLAVARPEIEPWTCRVISFHEPE